jgi:hypothetical protein
MFNTVTLRKAAGGGFRTGGTICGYSMPGVLKTSWAHFISYRLPQGRRIYSNPLPKTASRRRHPPELQREMQRPTVWVVVTAFYVSPFTFHLSPSCRAQSQDSWIYSRSFAACRAVGLAKADPFAVLFRKSPTGCAKTRERSRSRTICCGRDHSCFSRRHHSRPQRFA